MANNHPTLRAKFKDKGGYYIVLFPTICLHVEGKKSLVNGIFHFFFQTPWCWHSDCFMHVMSCFTIMATKEGCVIEVVW